MVTRRQDPRQTGRASKHGQSTFEEGIPLVCDLSYHWPNVAGVGAWPPPLHSEGHMQNRWVESDAADKDGLDQLVYLSRAMGVDPGLVLWGGGNTSIKAQVLDYRGRTISAMYIKGSGADMKDSERRHFPAVDLDGLLPIFERDGMDDDEMVDYVRRCMLDPTAPRPSIETLLHAFLPHKCVAHSHADAILSLTNNVRARDALGSLYGREVATVAYRRPGFLLSKEVALAAPEAVAVVLMNHGLVTWGDTAKQAYDAHIELVGRAEEFIADHAAGRSVFGPPASSAPLDSRQRREVAQAVAPTLRGLVGKNRRMILRFDDSEEVMAFVASRRGGELSGIGPATPDHTLHTKRLPLWVEVDDPRDPGRVKAAIRREMEAHVGRYQLWFEAHRADGVSMLDPYPRVVLVSGIGMWATGRDATATRTVNDIYRHTIGIVHGAEAVGGYQTLSAKEAYDAEYWPLELYKLTLPPPEKELARRVALVTGAASGIGRAIARRFAAEGAHVVVTDLDGEGAGLVAAELVQANGAERAIACRLDVTSEEEVSAAFKRVRLAYGGVDIVVSNAGIAAPGLIEELSSSDWRKAMEVNATGHFLVAREAIRTLREAGAGGSLVFVGTKNVPAPGREFGAYSASKAAEAQLARVLALENGEHGIRVNIVNPDAVFRDSKLWSEEVRGQRAAAHGVEAAGLEEFYRRRNLLRVTITPEDVAEAALFLASDRSAKTTGAMLPVDGGVREAFPR